MTCWQSPARLLAISKRSTLSERVSDALVIHGNRDVVLSVTRNEGARFSDAGYGKLVDRSINDEMLAICVSLRSTFARRKAPRLESLPSDLGRPTLGLDELAIDKALGDLHRV